MPIFISLFLFGLPHVFYLDTFQIFSVNKFLWILCFTALFCGMIAKDFVTKKQVSILPFPHFWTLAAVFIVGCCSSAWFSNIPLESFFGGASRHFGVLFLGVLFLWFVFLLSRNFSDHQWKKWVIAPLLVTGGFMSLWAIVQGFNIYLVFPHLDLEALSYRSFAGMGQPNFLAQALLVPLFAAMWFAVFAQQKLVQFVSFLLFVFGMWAMWETGSRAGILAVVLGGIVFAGLWVSVRTQMKRWAALGIGIAFGVLAGLWGIVFGFGDHLALLLGDRGASVEARYFFWNEGISLLQHHWFLGVGADMVQHHVSSILSSAAFAAENFSAIPDRLHTVWLDFWIQYGIIPFLLVMFGIGSTVIRGVFQSAKGDIFAVFAVSGMVSLLTAWSFGFAILTDSIFFVLCVALVWRKAVVSIPFPGYFAWTKAVGALVVGVFLLGVSWKIFMAEVSLFQMSQQEITHPHERMQALDTLLDTPFLSQNLVTAYSFFPYSSDREVIVNQLKNTTQDPSFGMHQVFMHYFATQGESNRAKESFENGWQMVKHHPVFAWNFLRSADAYRLISADEFARYQTEIQNSIPLFYFDAQNSELEKFQKFWKHHSDFMFVLFDGKTFDELVRSI